MHVVFATTALASIAAALPSTSFVVHEKRDGDPIAWIKQDAASKDQVLPIRIGLKQQNLENLYQYVMDVADPDSPNFGKHWSPEKIASTFEPRQQTADETKAWLVNSGIDAKRIKTSAGRNWLEFSATVGEAERLLNTKYYSFKHKESDGTRIASDQYSLPAHIQKHVDFVMPTVQLDGLKPSPKSAMVIEAPSPIHGLNGTANCKKLTTIDCIRALYGVPVPARDQKPNPYNQMGIAEWADYLYLPDLKAFYKNFTKPRIPQSLEPEFISIDGGKRGDESRLEAGTVVESGLDFMTAISIIYPQNTRLYQVGDGVNVDSVGTFNIFLDALDKSYCSYKGGDQPYIDPAYPDPNDGGYKGPLQCGGAPMSNVFSVSYGQIEGALPRFYQERQCEEWAKLALQGVSVLFASGDSGVANRYNAGYPDSCLDVKDKYVDPNGKRFSPSFPANCPYITAVGATTLLTNDIKDGERAVDRFGSGGGFSDIFVAPDYQKNAVTNYLKNYAPPYGDDIFNSSGRGFPDIAALGDTLATVINGTVHGVGGTSASAPLFAGIITVLNEERLKNGRGPIGFLNPTIYKHPEIFNDVTVGDNPGCGTRGFPASKGWDPVTGMGTPNYEKMRDVFTKLP